jgi:hypothetical protein
MQAGALSIDNPYVRGLSLLTNCSHRLELHVVVGTSHATNYNADPWGRRPLGTLRSRFAYNNVRSENKPGSISNMLRHAAPLSLP